MLTNGRRFREPVKDRESSKSLVEGQQHPLLVMRMCENNIPRMLRPVFAKPGAVRYPMIEGRGRPLYVRKGPLMGGVSAAV